MRKTKAEAQQTRQALLDAALDVFYRRGVAHASLQEIAAAAGLTRGALYWHFKNKEDLLDALFQQFCSDLDRQFDADLAAATPDIWHNLHTSTIQVLYRLADDPAFRKFGHIIHLNCEHTEHNHTITGLLHQYRDLWHQRLRSALKLSLAQGNLPPNTDIELAAFAYHATLKGMMDLWLMAPQSLDLKQTAPKLIAACSDHLLSSPHLRIPPAADASDTAANGVKTN